MNLSRSLLIAFVLLTVAAGARILLQAAAMPPYAGLDEIYHVARVNFAQEENRSPTSDEPSVAIYIHESLALEEGVLPDFVQAAPQWHKMVRGGYALPSSAPVPLEERTTYLTPNYQAQQASLYYAIAAPLTTLGDGSRLSELWILRFFSASLTLLAILATGFIGHTVAGIRGVAVSALLLLLPTWHTLMVRASNDALAVASLVVALAFTIRGSERAPLAVAEGLAWGIALATKLFTWPLLIVLPIVWWWQKTSRVRMAVVAIICLASLIGTSLELRSRTGVAVGLGAFNEPAVDRVEAKPIAYWEMVKITISSAIWMSGQHNNALTPTGMVLYVLPPALAMLLLVFLAPPKGDRRIWTFATMAALGAFALAQAFHASAHIRNARLLGESMPAAGKEGWYWFALAPLLVGVFLAPLFERVRCVFLVLASGWLLAWDVMISEGALFRDYAGLTASEAPGLLFRWGPAPVLSLGLGRALDGLAAGPFTEAVWILRGVSVMAIAALLALGCRFGSAAPEASVQAETAASLRCND